MQLRLSPHPACRPSEPWFDVWVDVQHAHLLGATATTNLWFCVGAPMDRFVVPQAEEPARKDELWRTTCFELFLRREGEEAYREWNFAPSGEWAAYDFASYRGDPVSPDIDHPPHVRTQDNLTWWQCGATISLKANESWEVALSAVLEEQDGTKSYWALAHAANEPDFHHPDCFAAKLP